VARRGTPKFDSILPRPFKEWDHSVSRSAQTSSSPSPPPTVVPGDKLTRTTVAPLLASRVFFANTVDNDEGLQNVQWVYLGVACFVGLLIILFFLAPFPEITDADMNVQETEIGNHDATSFWRQKNLFLAVWSQFCYVGAQVAVAVSSLMGIFFFLVEGKLIVCCPTELLYQVRRRGRQRC
jgi:hypothetical protein